MNKARKKAYKPATMKRLVRESLVLSSTRFVSSRVVRFFETGLMSPLFTTVKTVDSFVRDKITGPLFKKAELRKNFSKPARNAVASAVSRNPIMTAISRLRAAILNTPLRSVGIFLLTFGIYAAAIFLLKRYISFEIGVADTDDLCVAAVTFVVGLLLAAFGDKSIITALGNGRISGSLLSGALGVNDSTFDRAPRNPSKTAVGVSFLLGSLLGVSTLFFTPLRVLFTFALLIVFIAVMHIPEFGLLLAVGTISFVPIGYSAALSAVTLLSYLIKCVRLKRNLRFGTADSAVLILFMVMMASCLFTGGNVNSGEFYLLCFTLLYFAAKNLICSDKLLAQTFNALCVGSSFGMALFILGHYAEFIDHDNLRLAAKWLTRYTLNADMLALLASATIPFALSMFSSTLGKKSKLLTLLLACACAVISDSILFYALVLLSLFLYIASAYKAPFGALLGGLVVGIPTLSVASDFASSPAVTAFAQKGYDVSFALSAELTASSFWEALSDISGILSVLLFAVSLLLILQRVTGSAITGGSEHITRICGTVAASSIVIVICSFLFNPFSDLRVLAFIWFVLGLCGSVYKVSSQPEREV